MYQFCSSADGGYGFPYYISQSVERCWGFPIAEWQVDGKRFLDMIDPEDRDQMILSIEHSARTG